MLALLGTYYAATDGVLMAMGSMHVPEAMRGSGLALLGTATSVARLFASLVFGGLWTWLGLETAIAVFAVALVAAMLVGARSLRAGRERACCCGLLSLGVLLSAPTPPSSARRLRVPRPGGPQGVDVCGLSEPSR